MGILGRFKDIMSSNMNALLDKAEDPQKMMDQCLRNLNDDLRKVKSETAAVMAEEQRIERSLGENRKEMETLQNYARKAVEAGNDQDARRFLEQKTEVSEKIKNLETELERSRENTTQMKQMHQKLSQDIKELELRKSQIKGKMSIAKTQNRLNSMNSSVESANQSMSAFERMEDKANRMLDESRAMAELNQPLNSDLKSLKEKYSATASEVDDELAALKEELQK